MQNLLFNCFGRVTPSPPTTPMSGEFKSERELKPTSIRNKWVPKENAHEVGEGSGKLETMLFHEQPGVPLPPPVSAYRPCRSQKTTFDFDGATSKTPSAVPDVTSPNRKSRTFCHATRLWKCNPAITVPVARTVFRHFLNSSLIPAA